MESVDKIPVIKSETLTVEELKEIVYHKDGGSPDDRFKSEEKGGAFYYSPLDSICNYFYPNKEGVLFSVVYKEGEIVGIAELEHSPYDDGEIWLKSVSVDVNRKGEGLSKKLLEEVFEYVKSTGKRLGHSSFTEEGSEKIKRTIESLSEEYGVEAGPARS